VLESAVDYEWRVAHERAAKDAFFRTSPHSATYVLAFNAAYHPYCAHAPDHSCPLTRAENRLPDRIEASERLATAGVR